MTTNTNLILRAAALSAAMLCGMAQAGPQAYVASSGSDANTAAGCSRAKICRTLRAAMSVVDAGGVVVALDAAEYGFVRITKSVTIEGNGLALIAPPAGDGIDIPAAGLDVVLRGLIVKGSSGGSGINVMAAGSLTVDKCEVSNFLQGLFVDAAAHVHVIDSVFARNSNGARFGGGAAADVARSYFIDNRGAGVVVGATGVSTSVSMADSFASDNHLDGVMVSGDATSLGQVALIRSTASNNRRWGFAVTSGGILSVGESLAAGNATGFAQIPGIVSAGPPGVFETLGNNIVRQNGTATTGNITAVPGI